MRTWLVIGAALLAVLLLPPEAVAAKRTAVAAGLTMASAMKTAAVVGPLGISPFFALAAFGVADTLGLWQAPAGLQPLAHPVVWVPMLVLGLVMQFGRSTKITKPFAEALGTGESALALFSLALMIIPQLSGETAPLQKEAGVMSGLLLLTAATTALVVLIVLRTALDVLIWLSPFPFVDFLFQVAKVAVTLGLVALAVVSPLAALIVNALLIAATLVTLRWALRTARFGITVAHDLTVGRFRQEEGMPRDPVVSADLGPFLVFALDVDGMAKRQRTTLSLQAGRWCVEGRPIGDADRARITSGILGTELEIDGQTVLFPPRYRHLMTAIADETKAVEAGPTARLAAAGA